MEDLLNSEFVIQWIRDSDSESFKTCYLVPWNLWPKNLV